MSAEIIPLPAATVTLVRDRVATPLVVDADNGYGNALNVERTVRLFERAGASAIQLEDQSYPKRCGHLQDKTLIGQGEMVGKIRAALDARASAETLIIARTDAVAVEGFERAVERAEAYAEAGADVLFVEAPRSADQLAAVTKALGTKRPLVANMVEGGDTPLASAAVAQGQLKFEGNRRVVQNLEGGVIREIRLPEGYGNVQVRMWLDGDFRSLGNNVATVDRASGDVVATDLYAQQDSRRWAGVFNAGGEAKDGHTPEEVEAAIYEELEKLANEPVPAQELQKVKNNFAAGEYRKLSNNHAIMQALLRYDGLGHWQEINEAGPKLQAVTAADVKRVAEAYLTKDNRNVATVVRKAGKSASEDPDLVGLSPQQLPVVRQFLGHEGHRRTDVTEEALVPGAQVIERAAAVTRRQEPVLGTLAMTGEPHVAADALGWQAVALRIERAGGVRRVVVVLRQRAEAAHGGERERGDHRLRAAGEERPGVAQADHRQRVAQRVSAGGAGGVDRRVRAAHADLAAEAAGAHVLTHARDDERVHAARAPLQVRDPLRAHVEAVARGRHDDADVVARLGQRELVEERLVVVQDRVVQLPAVDDRDGNVGPHGCRGDWRGAASLPLVRDAFDGQHPLARLRKYRVGVPQHEPRAGDAAALRANLLPGVTKGRRRALARQRPGPVERREEQFGQRVVERVLKADGRAGAEADAQRRRARRFKRGTQAAGASPPSVAVKFTARPGTMVEMACL